MAEHGRPELARASVFRPGTVEPPCAKLHTSKKKPHTNRFLDKKADPFHPYLVWLACLVLVITTPYFLLLQLTMAENHVAPLSGPEKEVKMLERSIQSSRHCFIQNFRDTGKMSEAGFKVRNLTIVMVHWEPFNY